MEKKSNILIEERILKEYKINDYMTLKLIGVRDFGIGDYEKTLIFVNNDKFLQCMYILLNKDKDNLSSTENIDSIDEAVERLDHSLEDHSLEIPPETIFFAHCSNIQVWAESGYDTRFLHRNLAFPLLKKLADAGDSIAKKAFKEEISNRFEKGNENTRTFLIDEGYLDYLTPEELMVIVREDNYDEIMQKIEIAEEIRQQIPYYRPYSESLYSWDANYDLLEEIEGNVPDGWTVFDNSE